MSDLKTTLLTQIDEHHLNKTAKNCIIKIVTRRKVQLTCE